MKVRYKYKVDELVEFYLPDNETLTQTTFMSVIFSS